MFESVDHATPDAILGLTEAFRNDPNPNKINLGVGIYENKDGKTPTLQAVTTAEQRLAEQNQSKKYKPISGDPVFGELAAALALGQDHRLTETGRVKALHTPGGTGGLRVAGDYLARCHPQASVWLSEPTWPNHPAVFAAAGVPTRTYPYFDAEHNRLDFDAMIQALNDVPPGDVVLLHGCCHNPTGIDPDADQWRQLAELLAKRHVLPLVDFAYQGFGRGLEEDAAGLRTLGEHCPELLAVSSFSKNFGLYCDRVGALMVVGKTSEQTDAVHSRLKKSVRPNYSNPPAHGAAIVRMILEDQTLKRQWLEQLDQMRGRINAMRWAFATALTSRGIRLSPQGNDFITRQSGMFTLSGLSPAQITSLRDNHAIYIVANSRLNLAAMNPDHIDYLCDAIGEVTRSNQGEK